MLSELNFLYLFLGIGFTLAPLMTNAFFLGGSKIYSVAHLASLALLLLAAASKVEFLVLVWPLFCALGLLLYLKNDLPLSFSPQRLAAYLPFAFSLISSVWFAGGILDWRILGYGQAWSFYAAIHGCFLGWIFVGCLVRLSREQAFSRLYLSGSYLCFLFFLLVAFGIDGVPYVKRIGVLGLSFIVPGAIALYAFRLARAGGNAFWLSGFSFLSIAVSMCLALLNEYWLELPRIAFGLPIMVLVHGSLNAVVAIPLFYFAIQSRQNHSLRL